MFYIPEARNVYICLNLFEICKSCKTPPIPPRKLVKKKTYNQCACVSICLNCPNYQLLKGAKSQKPLLSIGKLLKNPLSKFYQGQSVK